MPYITSIERSGIQKGILQDAQEAVVDILETRFEQVPHTIVEGIKRINDPSTLRMLRKKAVIVGSLEEFEQGMNTYT